MKKYAGAAIFIALICCSLFLGYKVYSLGNSTEREKILAATVWQLSKDGYKENFKKLM